MNKNITFPDSVGIEMGDTYLSIKSVNGHLYVVDQNGKLINGIISITGKSTVDDKTTMIIECISYQG